jgi:hypothetical protein
MSAVLDGHSAAGSRPNETWPPHRSCPRCNTGMDITLQAEHLATAIRGLSPISALRSSEVTLTARSRELIVVARAEGVIGRFSIPVDELREDGVATCTSRGLAALAALHGPVRLHVRLREGAEHLYAFEGETARMVAPCPAPTNRWLCDDVATSRVTGRPHAARILARALRLSQSFAGASLTNRETHSIRVLGDVSHVHVVALSEQNRIDIQVVTEPGAPFLLPASRVAHVACFLRESGDVFVHEGRGMTYLRNRDGALIAWDRPHVERVVVPPMDVPSGVFVCRQSLKTYLAAGRQQLGSGEAHVTVSLNAEPSMMQLQAVRGLAAFEASIPLTAARNTRDSSTSTHHEALLSIDDLSILANGRSGEIEFGIRDGVPGLAFSVDRGAFGLDGRLYSEETAPVSAIPFVAYRFVRIRG